ncbi:MAG: bifunctional heptose 7-phosphate kinase/heptose 1-phosphate adenyltransferase [Thermoguttaceae bacterium]|nr:bifunctional heptose 7-phosphate kinase/heptose 1-phosphate adenyltransferase [Thermoguttaceae bacterium]
MRDYIEKFSNVKALAIGDLMLDRFAYGTVDRISPEAPVPVLKIRSCKEMLGGAGNVVANLAALGCVTTFVGVVGQDSEGRRVAELLSKVQCWNRLFFHPEAKTIVKERMIAANSHLLRVDKEERLPDLSPIWDEFFAAASQAIRSADVVLLSDYNKGFFTPKTTQAILKLCREFGKPAIVDPKGRDYSKYNGATFVKPNLKEFQEASERELRPADPNFRTEAIAAAKRIFERYEIENLLTTLSEYGMMRFSRQNPDDPRQIPTEAKEVFDVSGAGDTSLATFGAALGAGASVEEAMELANLASGIVVGKLGTASATAAELRDALDAKRAAAERAIEAATAKTVRIDAGENAVSAAPSEKTSNFGRRKLLTREELAEVVADLKRRGKTVGFTNGCFDCMHFGHLNSFAQARAECDALIVAVNSDASVKRYKGPNRPIQNETTRSAIVAALELVDYVVVFDEDTAEPLIDLLRPDVVAKEGYSLDRWPEGRQVVAYGGRAVELKRVEGYSTTNLVERMKRADEAKEEKR